MTAIVHVRGSFGKDEIKGIAELQFCHMVISGSHISCSCQITIY
jgi:hypothetical protein